MYAQPEVATKKATTLQAKPAQQTQSLIPQWLYNELVVESSRIEMGIDKTVSMKEFFSDLMLTPKE